MPTRYINEQSPIDSPKQAHGPRVMYVQEHYVLAVSSTVHDSISSSRLASFLEDRDKLHPQGRRSVFCAVTALQLLQVVYGIPH